MHLFTPHYLPRLSLLTHHTDSHLTSTSIFLLSPQSLSELESTENPRFDPARCRSRSTSTISPFRTPRESDLEEFKCITMKANTVDEVTRKEERKRVRSLRKSASDLSLTGPPSIGGWLECLGLKQYESHFVREGFSDIESVRFVVLSYTFYRTVYTLLTKL